MAWMPRRRIRFAIGLDVLGQLAERALPYRDKNRQAEASNLRKRLGGRRRHAQFRIGLLIRLRADRDMLEAVIVALVGKRRLGPRPLQDLQRLGEALAALAVGNAVILIGAHDAAAADAVDQPAMADLV